MPHVGLGVGCPESWWKGSKHKPDPCGNFIFADSKQGGVSSHTVLLASPYSWGPCSFLHVEVLGLHLPLVCFGIKPLGFPWWSGS